MTVSDEKRKRITQIKNQKSSVVSEYHQLHINKLRNQEIERKDDFNLQKHLTELTDYYCENMSEEQKKIFTSRIGRGNDIQHVPDLDYFPTDHPEDLTDAYAKNSFMHERGNAITKELLKEFCDAGSKPGNDLKEILENSEIEIIIRSKWQRPNGTASFKRKENDKEKDKIVICLSDQMFTDEHIDKLPGLLAHEMSHILDFQKRSGGHIQFMEGAETFADTTGQIMAAKAGYSSLYWGHFMNDAFNADGRKKMPLSPDGDFRLKTIEMSEKINPPKPEKNIRNLSSYKKYSESDRDEHKNSTSREKTAPRWIQRLGNKISTLRGTRASDKPIQRNNSTHNTRQSSISYIPSTRDR